MFFNLHWNISSPKKIWSKAEKIEEMIPRNSRKYHYIEYDEFVPYPIQWWKLLNDIRYQGYRLNPKIQTQPQRLQEIILFDYVAEILEMHGLLRAPEHPFLKQILENVVHSRSFIYQLLIAANYLSNNFSVSFPEITGSGNVDIKVKKDDKVVLVECKSIEPPYYNSLVAEVLRRMQKIGLNKALFIKIKKPPYDRKHAKELALQIIKSCQGEFQADDFTLEVIDLPHMIRETVKNKRSRPPFPLIDKLCEELGVDRRKLDRIYFSCQSKILNNEVFIKDLKLIIIREQNVKDIIRKKLLENLKKARSKLKKERGVDKLICIDISNVIGRLSNLISESGIKPVNVAKMEAINHLKQVTIRWLNSHQDVIDVILSTSHLYEDPSERHLFLTFVPIPAKNIKPSIYPQGWTIDVLTI